MSAPTRGPSVRGLLKWSLLTILAVTLGGSAGAAYKLYVAPPDEIIIVTYDEPLTEGVLAENDTPPPTLPVPRQPAHGTTISTLTPTFTWDASHGTKHVIYALEYTATSKATGLQIKTTVQNLERTTFTVATQDSLPPGSVVTWRLMAIDTTLQDSGWTEPRTFHVLVAG